MDELDNLLKKLGIYDDFELLGHSWGGSDVQSIYYSPINTEALKGMLVGHYAASRTPSGLKKLIISNSPASVPLLVAGTNFLLEKFPSDFVENLRKLEEEGKTTSPEYQQGVMQFYKKHVCTTNPWPQGWMYSFNALEKNPTVYHAM